MVTRPGRVAKKHMLVTGAGCGIGRATALLLAQEEAALIMLVDRNVVTLHETVSLIREEDYRGTLVPVRCDLAETDAAFIIESTVQKISQKGLDGVAAIAGCGIANDIEIPSGLQVEEALRCNLLPTLNTVDATVGSLCQRGGSLVTISSINSIIGAQPAYGMAKSMIETLTMQIGTRYSNHHSGLRANVLRLGSVDSQRVWGSRKHEDPIGTTHYLNSIPLGRLGTMQEAAQMIVNLLVPGYTHLQIITMDGGVTAPMAHLSRMEPNIDRWWAK